MKKVVKYILLFLNFLAAGCLIISYSSGYLSPEKWWLPSFFGLAYPFIFLINLFFVFMWLINKPSYMFLSLGVIILGFGFIKRSIQIKGRSIEKGDIEVLSYNVRAFTGQGTDENINTAQAITEFLREQEPDIICLQEVRLRKNSIFNLAETVKDLQFIKHYQYARSSTTFGSVTMTRYPIVNMGEIRFRNSRNMSIFTDMLIEGDTVRVYNIHLQSYRMDPDSYSIIYKWPEEKNDLKKIREMGSRLKNSFYMRAQQVETIREHIESCPHKIILCGDFNDTPVSYSYMQLNRKLKDAFVCSGKGIMPTYIGKLPSLRIDYIFHSKEYGSYSFQTHDFRYSDHLPVSCSLVKK